GISSQAAAKPEITTLSLHDALPIFEAMAHRLKTPEGKKRYALRKQIPEPVFGIIKSALGFRQFLLRGLDNVRGEWRLVTMAWNLDRKSTRLNSSHDQISYAVFRLKK